MTLVLWAICCDMEKYRNSVRGDLVCLTFQETFAGIETIVYCCCNVKSLVNVTQPCVWPYNLVQLHIVNIKFSTAQESVVGVFAFWPCCVVVGKKNARQKFRPFHRSHTWVNINWNLASWHTDKKNPELHTFKPNDGMSTERELVHTGGEAWKSSDTTSFCICCICRLWLGRKHLAFDSCNVRIACHFFPSSLVVHLLLS